MKNLVLNELVNQWKKQCAPLKANNYEDSPQGMAQESHDKGVRDGISRCIKDVESLIELMPDSE